LLRYVVRRNNGKDLGRAQIRRGWAHVYVYAHHPFRRVKADKRAQRLARGARVGVWRLCGGKFHIPPAPTPSNWDAVNWIVSSVQERERVHPKPLEIPAAPDGLGRVCPRGTERASNPGPRRSTARANRTLTPARDAELPLRHPRERGTIPAQRIGFDPTLGPMHAKKRYRLSLASDLMESARSAAEEGSSLICSRIEAAP
jgi:hypothetical protein